MKHIKDFNLFENSDYIKWSNDMERYGSDKFVFKNGDTAEITEFNSPRTSSESPNNISLDFKDKNNELIFFVSRIGEITFSSICSADEKTDSAGDLILKFSKDAFSVIDKDNGNIIFSLSGEDRKDFAMFFGLHIGYNIPEIEKMYQL